MPQLFPRSSNTLVRAILLAGFLLIVGGAFAGWRAFWSPLQTQVGLAAHQPVPFSHKHHVHELGIDCRYCHTGVETSRFAGLPPTETCMTCHSQIWRDAPVLAPVRESWRENKPLQWVRLNDLPDYTYFDHHIHVAKGVACESCHGDVEAMPLTVKSQSLAMRWCLECHQHPERELRPPADVFRHSAAPADPPTQAGLARDARIDTTRLSDCSTCHR